MAQPQVTWTVDTATPPPIADVESPALSSAHLAAIEAAESEASSSSSSYEEEGERRKRGCAFRHRRLYSAKWKTAAFERRFMAQISLFARHRTLRSPVRRRGGGVHLAAFARLLVDATPVFIVARERV